MRNISQSDKLNGLALSRIKCAFNWLTFKPVQLYNDSTNLQENWQGPQNVDSQNTKIIYRKSAWILKYKNYILYRKSAWGLQTMKYYAVNFSLCTVFMIFIQNSLLFAGSMWQNKFQAFHRAYTVQMLKLFHILEELGEPFPILGTGCVNWFMSMWLFDTWNIAVDTSYWVVAAKWNTWRLSSNGVWTPVPTQLILNSLHNTYITFNTRCVAKYPTYIVQQWNSSIRATPFVELLWPLLRGGHSRSILFS